MQHRNANYVADNFLHWTLPLFAICPPLSTIGWNPSEAPPSFIPLVNCLVDPPNSRLQHWCKWAGRCLLFLSSRRLRDHHSRKSLRSFIYVAEMWRPRGYSTNQHSRSPMESPQSAVHHISLWYTSNEWQKQAIKPWRACCISGPIT